MALVLVLWTSSRAAEALKFPTGPAGTGRFGAYTTRLEYDAA
jgi:hypothetical protein